MQVYICIYVHASHRLQSGIGFALQILTEHIQIVIYMYYVHMCICVAWITRAIHTCHVCSIYFCMQQSLCNTYGIYWLHTRNLGFVRLSVAWTVMSIQVAVCVCLCNEVHNKAALLVCMTTLAVTVTMCAVYLYVNMCEVVSTFVRLFAWAQIFFN